MKMRLVHVVASFSGDVFVHAGSIVSGAVERLEVGYEGHGTDTDCRKIMAAGRWLDEVPEFVNDIVWGGRKVWFGRHQGAFGKSGPGLSRRTRVKSLIC